MLVFGFSYHYYYFFRYLIRVSVVFFMNLTRNKQNDITINSFKVKRKSNYYTQLSSIFYNITVYCNV